MVARAAPSAMVEVRAVKLTPRAFTPRAPAPLELRLDLPRHHIGVNLGGQFLIFCSRPRAGVFVEPAAMSVNEYLDRWLRDAARPRVSRRTADGYAGLLDRYIRASLGHKQLDKLQPLDIQRVYGEIQARGLSARIVRHAHSALHNALRQAVKWGLLSRNPSDLVELPKVPHKERRVLSPDEAQEFLKAADVMPAD